MLTKMLSCIILLSIFVLATASSVAVPSVSRSSAITSEKLVDSLVGYYENLKYTDASKNQWHYVDLKKVDGATLHWMNRAGIKWSLSVQNSTDGSINTEKLAVGTDSPYYKRGFTESTIVRDDSGAITAITGPGNELYLRFPGTASELVDSVIGTYQNLKYTGSSKNDWHYVQIEKVDESTLRWTNRGGIKWSMFVRTVNSKLDTEMLVVGSDCPYYKKGHKLAKIVRDNESGKIKAILGPFNESYHRFPGHGSDVLASVVGSYENLLYSGENKNDWHYVNVEQADSSTLRWSNRAGVKWTLYMRSVSGKIDASTLVVGSDCPYYKRGYKLAKISRDANGLVNGILGPWNEKYTRDALTETEVAKSVVGKFENLLYYGSTKNDWHYVTVEKLAHNKLRWVNRAGVKWTITIRTVNGKVDTAMLDVGTDCPYHKHGYIKARLVRDTSTGAIKDILGPFNEPYSRQY